MNRISCAASLIFAVGALLSMLVLKYFASPYIFLAMYWITSFLFLTLQSRTQVSRAIWFNLAFLVFILGALEVHAYFYPAGPAGNTRYEGGYADGYFVPNDILGYGPAKGRVVRSKKFKGKRLIYDVTYTINDEGLRLSPSWESDGNQCALFFGGSFTFGEGVNDHEAMPYVVGDLSHAKVYNFGFHGYGPHQMLSAIQHGVVEKIIDCKPKWAIYQALGEHVARSAGYSSWDQHGPKYVISDGHLKYDGHFDDNKLIKAYGSTVESAAKRIVAQFLKSYFYSNLMYWKKDAYTIHDQDVELFVRILVAARRELVEKYPGIKFHVIIWDTDHDSPTHKKIEDGLSGKSISTHSISNILHGIMSDQSKFEINDDEHPNHIAHRLIAEYVVKSIMGVEHSQAVR